MTLLVDFLSPAPPDVLIPNESSVNVLVVDDSPVDRRLAGSIVERQRRWNVHYAGNGQEALALLERTSVQAILTDMLMPEMDGLELVEAVRLRYPFIPVVLMTAFGSEDVAVQALQRGASSYVPKRVLPRELGPTLDRVLAAARSHRDRHRLRNCLARTEAHYILDNDPSLAPPLVACLQEQLACLGLGDQTDAIRMGIAVEEAILNGICHGNLELKALRAEGGIDPADQDGLNELLRQRRETEPFRSRRLHVEVQLSRREVAFVIRDEGAGFDSTCLPNPSDPVRQGPAAGRGMLLIRTFMDEVRFNGRGNEITLVKHIAA